MQICVACELSKYPIEKLRDEDFVRERCEEFYPIDEFLGYAYLCDDCAPKLIARFLRLDYIEENNI